MTRRKGREPREAVADCLHAGEQEKNAGYHLVELYDVYVRLLQSRTHSNLMNLSLTQWRMLTLIRFNPDRTQRTLSRAVGIDPSTMTPLIDLFETKGWVRRHQSATNRSAYNLRMTAAGARAYRQIEREMAHAEKLIRDLLGESDRQMLLALLRTLRAGIARQMAPIER
jgi:DNA-binding MarR family transcriptional regulator